MWTLLLQTSKTFMDRYIQTLEKDNNTNGRRPEGFQVNVRFYPLKSFIDNQKAE